MLMSNKAQSHTANTADQAKTKLLAIAAQRRREMERDHRMLAVPAAIDMEPMPMQRSCALPMWSAIHD
jgi:hypothetical protein